MTLLSTIVSNVALALLLSLLAYCVQRSLRQPAIARVLWVLVLVKLLTPPLLRLEVASLPGSIACTACLCDCGRHADSPSNWVAIIPSVLGLLWLTGAVVTACMAGWRWNHFRRLLKHARPAPPDWQSLVKRMAAELCIRPPQVVVVPGPLPPLVIAGVRRARLVLPMQLIARLSAAQRRALLLHELTHLQRRDHLVRMLEIAVHVVYWWLPGVVLIGRQLRRCEEACCDAAVVARFPRKRRDYARLLLDVLDLTDPLPQSLASQSTQIRTVDDMEQRLREILGQRRPMRSRCSIGLLVVALACMALPCSAYVDVTARPERSAARVDRSAVVPVTADELASDVFESPATWCCPS